MCKLIWIISLLIVSVLLLNACGTNPYLPSRATATAVTTTFTQSLSPSSINDPTGASPMTPTQSQTTDPSSASTPPSSIPASWNRIPIPTGAFSGSEGNGKYMYLIVSTVEEVQDYYEKMMPKLGWLKMETAVGQYEGVQLMYYKDGRIARIRPTQVGDRVFVVLGWE